MNINHNKVAYDSNRSSVNFAISIDEGNYVWRVTEEALTDHFGATSIDPEDLVAAAQANLEIIGRIAERKYRSGHTDADGTVTVKTADC